MASCLDAVDGGRESVSFPSCRPTDRAARGDIVFVCPFLLSERANTALYIIQTKMSMKAVSHFLFETYAIRDLMSTSSAKTVKSW